MRTFDYVFWACGHTSYRPTVYTFCDPSNMHGNFTIHDEPETTPGSIHRTFISKDICVFCQTSPIDNTQDPYIKNLVAISGLLTRTLINFNYSDNKAIRRARYAVTLLARMSRIYHVCSTSNPSQEEMRRHIQSAIRSVGYAIQQGENHDFGYQILMRTSVQPQFSQGTVERQLGGFTPHVFPVEPNVSSRTYELNLSRYYPPRRYSGYTLPYPELSEPDPNITATEFYPTEDISGFSEDVYELKDGVYMRMSTPAPIPSPTISDSIPWRKEPRVPLVKTYIEGRDNWACDFCGPECFCWRFDD
ncbi:hypothetical protein B0J11DRAFT_589369 [Dendryphion nanum]|uniref:Uncharacterized protein n=1 Tax=Dendryphion nanum TaxID=256645 RepID=A0A9P9IXN1_9PLEO|nr:hypothetical protein B0J11DRAFT_589369 [Dendryphion nanum]